MLYYIILYYVVLYILWTEWSLFRMWFNSFKNTLRLCLPTFQRHAAEAQLIFLDMGTWAKHCVWQSIPWNTMGSMYTVFPSSPHLHPPCSALCGFAEHEGWELINFRWCTYARIGYMCGSSSPGARWALPDRNPRNISGFAASYRHLYKRKDWKLRIGIGYIELGLVKRKETKLILYKASSIFVMLINEDGDHHIVPRPHQYRALAERYRFGSVSALLLVLRCWLWFVRGRRPRWFCWRWHLLWCNFGFCGASCSRWWWAWVAWGSCGCDLWWRWSGTFGPPLDLASASDARASAFATSSIALFAPSVLPIAL